MGSSRSPSTASAATTRSGLAGRARRRSLIDPAPALPTSSASRRCNRCERPSPEGPFCMGHRLMEPQERDLITTLLTRLESASKAGQPKDSEADALIRQAMTQMPDAPYYLVQTVLIQDLSLHNAQNRIDELEKQLAAASQPPQRTSFLGGLLGGGGQQQQGSVPPSGPWTRAPQAAPPPPQYAQPGYAPGYAQPGYAQPGYAPPGYAPPGYAPMGGGMFSGGGNSFLRSAATTAAGVAGGALLFQGISSLFGHSYASGLGGFGGLGGMGMGTGLGETVINNYNGTNPSTGGTEYARDAAGSEDHASDSSNYAGSAGGYDGNDYVDNSGSDL